MASKQDSLEERSSTSKKLKDSEEPKPKAESRQKPKPKPVVYICSQELAQVCLLLYFLGGLDVDVNQYQNNGENAEGVL